MSNTMTTIITMQLPTNSGELMVQLPPNSEKLEFHRTRPQNSQKVFWKQCPAQKHFQDNAHEVCTLSYYHNVP